MVDNSGSTLSCDIDITGSFSAAPLDNIGTVEYVASKNAWVHKVTPRWGGVEGGEQVVFEIVRDPSFAGNTLLSTV